MSLLSLAVHGLLAEFDVYHSLGAALIGGGVIGTIAAGRWIMSGSPDRPASGGAVAAKGSSAQYLKLALVMALGVGGVIAGVALRSH